MIKTNSKLKTVRNKQNFSGSRNLINFGFILSIGGLTGAQTKQNKIN